MQQSHYQHSVLQVKLRPGVAAAYTGALWDPPVKSTAVMCGSLDVSDDSKAKERLQIARRAH